MLDIREGVLRTRVLLQGGLLAAGLLLGQAANAEALSQQRLDAFASAMQAQVEQGKIGGIATLVYQNGEVVQRGNYGFQDREAEKPLRDDSLYKIFSLTKLVTGTGLLQLYDQGKFQLDDPVGKYLPQLKDLQVAAAEGPDGFPLTEPANHPVTIRELMTHTAGFTYGRFSQSQVDELYVKADIQDPKTTLAVMMDKLASIPLRQQPGTVWHYSISVDIQARLIEVLSDMPFDAYLKQHVFEPLNMVDTDFYAPPDKADRLAVSYMPQEDGSLKPLPNDFFLSKPSFLNGGGGLISSTDDYLRFARMLLNEGELDGKRLLKAETVRLMRQNQLPPGVDNIGPFFPGNQFGLNVAVVNDAKAAGYLPEGTFWWWGIQGAWAWIDPTNNSIVLGMMQNTDYRLSRVIHNTASQALYGPVEQQKQ
ncbi:serine hydrolase domain-containing protein [Halopseudomonas sabulinigri]|uniref:Serine hydrolase domain-containing protein n=1 Tax=Halopseudomonas sabulinigri TaxID=472181 RepID=A0ABP9ZQ32_9GAMM